MKKRLEERREGKKMADMANNYIIEILEVLKGNKKTKVSELDSEELKKIRRITKRYGFCDKPKDQKNHY